MSVFTAPWTGRPFTFDVRSTDLAGAGDVW